MRRGTLVGIVSRGVSLVTGLITIPLLLHYLGPAEFGIWATITSLTVLLSFADLGLSNGLVNSIADADAGQDRQAICRDISTAILALCVVAAALLTTTVVVSQILDPGVLVSSADAELASAPLVAFSTCFALGVPLGILMRIQIGLQESTAAYLWLALGNVLGVFGIFAVVSLGGSLTLVVVATAGGPVLAAVLNAIYFFGFRHPELRPRLAYVTLNRMRYLLASGVLFFIVQICIAISYQSDALVISHVIGAAAVAEYSVPMRVFYFAPVILNFALLPFWPAVRNAIAHRDVDWAMRMFARLTFIGSGAVLCVTVLLLLVGPKLIEVWTNGEATPSGGVLLALGFWAMTASLIIPLSYLVAGIGEIRFLAATHLLMTAVNLGLSILLAHHIGVAGVPLATGIADLACVVTPTAFYLPRAISKLKGRPESPSPAVVEPGLV